MVIWFWSVSFYNGYNIGFVIVCGCLLLSVFVSCGVGNVIWWNFLSIYYIWYWIMFVSVVDDFFCIKVISYWCIFSCY